MSTAPYFHVLKTSIFAQKIMKTNYENIFFQDGGL